MEIELVDKADNQVKYGIIYTRDDIKECIEQEAEAMQPEVKAKGFRPGKVPVDYIIRMYGEKLRIQSMNKKVTNDIIGIIDNNKYELASQPVYNFRPRQEVGDNHFYVELDLFLMPTLPDMKFEAIEIDEYVPDEEAFQEILDKNLLMFQIMTADFETITDAPSEDNDRMTFNVEVIINGTPDASLSGVMQAILGQEQVPSEIEAQLKGRKSGETVTYTHNYPADATDLFAPSLAGTETTYNIQIESVERPIIQELDEERIQKIGFRDYEHLFQILESNTRSTLKNISFSRMRHDFLSYLHDMYKDVAIPEFIVNQEAHLIAMNELAAISNDDVMKQITSGMTNLNVTERHHDIAKKSIRIGLFIKEYSKNNDVTISDNELKRELERHMSELTRLNSIKPDQKDQNYREIAMKAKAILMETKVLQSVFDRIASKEVHLAKDDYFEKVKIVA